MRRYSNNYKPPVGASINWGHKLADGLMFCAMINEVGGPPIDLVTNRRLTLVNSAVRQVTKLGESLDCGASDRGTQDTAWDLLARGVGYGATLVWRGFFNSTPGASSKFLNMSRSSTDSSPYSCMAIGPDNTTNNFLAECSSDATYLNEQTPVTWDTLEHQWAATFATPGTIIKTFRDRSNLSGSTLGGGFLYNPTSTAQVGIGTYVAGIGRSSNSNCKHALIYSRTLSLDEIIWLYEFPYDFLITTPKYRRYSYANIFVQLNQTAADSINNFAESISGSLSQAADLGVVTGDQLNLNDGVSLTGPPPDYFLLLGDSIANIQDSPRLAIELQKTFADSVNNLADAFASMVGIPIEAFDSQQFNWADSISTSFEAPLSLTSSDSINNYADFVALVLGVVRIDITAADTINNLADAVRLRYLLSLALGDNFVMSDSLRMRFTHLLGIADALGITDAVLTDVSAKPAFTDSIDNLNDAVSVALSAQYSLSVGDQLNLTDAVSVALDGVYNQLGFIARIRRYLGDIQSS